MGEPTHARLVLQPDGTTVAVPIDTSTPEGAAELARAAETGARTVFELNDQTRAELAREQYIDQAREDFASRPGADIVNPAISTVVGALEELSLGAFPGALGEETRLRARALHEEGGGETLGRGLGVLLPALATGGTSLLGQGTARSVLGRLAPAGALAGLANTVEGAVARRVARAGMGRGTATALGTAAGAAAEGGLGGLAHAVTQSNLQGTPLEGEQMAADGLFGLFLGMGFGGLAGGIRGGAVALRGRRAQQQARRMTEMGVASDIPSNLALEVPLDSPNFWSDVMERAARLPPENRSVWARGMAASLPDVESREAFYRLFAAGPRAFSTTGFSNAVQRASTEGTALADDIARATRPLLSGTARRELITRGLRVDPDVVAGARRSLDAPIAEIDNQLAAGGLGEASGWANDIRRRLVRIQAAESAADLVGGIDDLLSSSAFRRTTNEAGEDLAEIVRPFLHASGDAVSPNFANVRNSLDQIRGANADASRFFMQGRAVGGPRFSAEAMNRNLSQSAYHARRQELDSLFGWLRANDSALERLETLGVEGAAEARQSARSFGQQLPDLLEWGHIVGDMNALSAIESQGAGLFAAMGRGTIGAVLGGAAGLAGGGARGAGVGGLLGGATGLASALYSHPVGFLRQMAAVNTTLGRTQQRLAQGSQTLRRRMISPRLERAAVVGGRKVPVLVQNLRSPETREREYNAMVEQVREYASNPQMLLDTLETTAGPFSAIHPDVGGALSLSLVRGIHHLAAHLPPASTPSPFGHPDRRPSHAEMIDFVRRYEAIEDPYSLMEMAADGSLTESHVDAVRDAFPLVYMQIQSEVSAVIDSLDDPRKVPYALRTRVGMLLGVPGDDSLDPTFVFAMQQSYSQTAQQRQVQGPVEGSLTVSAEVADNTMTRAASLTHNL